MELRIRIFHIKLIERGLLATLHAIHYDVDGTAPFLHH